MVEGPESCGPRDLPRASPGRQRRIGTAKRERECEPPRLGASKRRSDPKDLVFPKNRRTNSLLEGRIVGFRALHRPESISGESRRPR